MREANESERAYITRRFKEVSDIASLDEVENQLEGEGYKTESIRPRKTERRQEIQKQGRSLVKTGATPLDAAIDKLRMPEVPEAYDGEASIYWAGFNEGVSFGANTILAGIRTAQELSSLGIAQATPVIRMAQELRQAEGQAAQVMAAELAQAVQSGNRDIINVLENLQATQRAGSTNPMQRMVGMIQSIPQMMNAMNALMGMFGMKPGIGQPPQPGGPPQPQPGPAQPPPMMKGPEQASREEMEEWFHDNE